MARGKEKKRRQVLWAQAHLQEELQYRAFHPLVRQTAREVNAILAHQAGMEALRRAEEEVKARLERERRWKTGWKRVLGWMLGFGRKGE